MSVPYNNPAMLWALPPDQFNHWRANNDLPLLLSFISGKLPRFEAWLQANEIDLPFCCRVVPTSELFIGEAGGKLLAEESTERETYTFFRACRSKEGTIELMRRQGKPDPKFKKIEPYFPWARRVLGRNRYFVPWPSSQKTDSFQYGGWQRALGSGPDAGISRAALFGSFQVLKLGQLVVGEFTQFGRRNLDFADLDGLIVEGGFHGGWSTVISYSSACGVTLQNAKLYRLTLRECVVAGFRTRDTELQSTTFLDCADMFGLGAFGRPVLEKSTVRGMSIIGSKFVPEFDDSDLLNLEYRPDRRAAPSTIADHYRILRAAYQARGRRREAADAYFNERVYERKALWNPYLQNREKFPTTRFPGSLKDAYEEWYRKIRSTRESVSAVFHIIWFHLRVWTTPKYALRALRYKIRYVIEVFEEYVWGYGERPRRVFAFAAVVIVVFAATFYFKRPQLLDFPKSSPVLNAAYFSVVTFTTLGYGDILPGSNAMKVICACEALLGAFTIGMVVAGFANRGRY